MANKPAPALPLCDGDQAILEKVVRSSIATVGGSAAGEDCVAGCPSGGVPSPRSPRSGRSTGGWPWEADTFTFSTDPELEAMVTDVVGLYLSLLVDVIVLCVDEKSQIQALDRT